MVNQPRRSLATYRLARCDRWEDWGGRGICPHGVSAEYPRDFFWEGVCNGEKLPAVLREGSAEGGSELWVGEWEGIVPAERWQDSDGKVRVVGKKL